MKVRGRTLVHRTSSPSHATGIDKMLNFSGSPDTGYPPLARLRGPPGPGPAQALNTIEYPPTRPPGCVSANRTSAGPPNAAATSVPVKSAAPSAR